MKLNKKYLALGVLGAVAASTAAYASGGNSATVTASVKFMTALAVTTTSNMDFGEVTKDSGGTYVLNSSTGAVTPSGGGETVGGSPIYGVVNIIGDASDTITISIGSYVASTHVTLSAATCTYGSSVNQSCDSGAPLTGQAAPGGSPGTDLHVGATATVTSGAAADSTETPSMTVTITYS